MELLLFRHAEFERLYLNQCSRINVDDIPLQDRIRPINGTIFILLFVIVEILYIPCIFAFWKRLGENSCYKFLFYIGITDMIVLWICGFFTGYFALTGAVFCTNPILIYVLGLIGLVFWFAESFAELCLAIDRCLEMTFPRIAERIFGGWRAWLWLAVISVYTTICFFYTKSLLYSSIFCSWFFQPLIGYVEDTENMYANYLHSFHDMFMAMAFPFVYLLFGLRLAYVSKRTMTPTNTGGNILQRKMFLQVAIISAFNCYACILYVIMQYIKVTEFHILMASYGWFFIHGQSQFQSQHLAFTENLRFNNFPPPFEGIPPFIYLSINKTIRNDCRKMIASTLFRMAKQVHAPTTVPPSMAIIGGKITPMATKMNTNDVQINSSTKMATGMIAIRS